MTITKDTFDMMRQAFWNSTKGDKLNHIELQLDEMTEEGFTVKVRVLTGCPGRTDLEMMEAHAKDLLETVQLARALEALELSVDRNAELEFQVVSDYREAQRSLDYYAVNNYCTFVDAVKCLDEGFRKEN